MRFIAHNRRFAVGILQPVTEILPGGMVREIVPIHIAEFQQGGLTLEETEFAERLFSDVPGRTMQTDEVTVTPIIGRLSVYDTETPSELAAFDTIDRALEGQPHPLVPRGEVWEEGTMQRVTEAKLVARAAETGEFALFEAAPAQAPWPTFNEFVAPADEIIAVLEAQGHYLPGALAYERQNLNRPELVEALEERIAAVGATEAEFVA